MNFKPGLTPCTDSFSPLQHDLAFEFGVDIINHLQSPSTKFELIALRYSGSREIDNGVTPPTLLQGVASHKRGFLSSQCKCTKDLTFGGGERVLQIFCDGSRDTLVVKFELNWLIKLIIIMLHNSAMEHQNETLCC